MVKCNGAARLRAVDVMFIENLFEIRIALEVMLVPRTALRCTPEDVTTLEAIKAELEQQITRED